MIPPHTVQEQGRVVILDDGPLHLEDIRDLRSHLYMRHRMRPEVIYVTEDQARWAYDWMDALYYDHRDPLNQRYPGTIGYLYGMVIARKAAIPRAVFHTTEGPPQVNTYATWGNWRMAPMGRIDQTGDMDAWKVQFGTTILQGAKFDGIWFDEPKRQPKTTHEVW